MSVAAQIIDALISSTFFPTYTTRHNALTDTFLTPERFGADDMPVVQGFEPTVEATPLDFGQVEESIGVTLMLIRAPDEGDEIQADIDAFKTALAANPTLAVPTPLVDRSEALGDFSAAVKDTNRTYAEISVVSVWVP